MPAGWTLSVKTFTMSSPRITVVVPPSSLATNTVPLGASDASWGTVPVMICGSARPPGRSTRTSAFALSTGTRTGPPGLASCRWRTAPGSGTRLVTSPESTLMRTSSFGFRFATATVRVTASTTTPSGPSPTADLTSGHRRGLRWCLPRFGGARQVVGGRSGALGGHAGGKQSGGGRGGAGRRRRRLGWR